MPRKSFTPEQIIAKLRFIEVAISSGKAAQLACKGASISEQSYYRWRKEYGDLQHDQAKRFQELERENVQLRKLVADLSLEKTMFKEVASGNW
jgi:transposase-like protein